MLSPKSLIKLQRYSNGKEDIIMKYERPLVKAEVFKFGYEIANGESSSTVDPTKRPADDGDNGDPGAEIISSAYGIIKIVDDMLNK